MQTLHYGNKLLADFVQKYFNLMVIRQSIYKTDVQLDEQCLSDYLKQFGELSGVMERLSMTPQPTAVDPERLFNLLEGGGQHFSFNFYVEKAEPETWKALIDGLVQTNQRNQKIQTLDLRGLRIPSKRGEMEVPYHRKADREVLKAGLENFSHLTVLALDATPNMFSDGFLAGLLAERLDALRLTAPAETNAEVAGISPHQLNDCVRDYWRLTQLTADVCTDQANARKEGRNVHEDLKQLFLSIAQSGTLQKVDLSAPVKLPQKWLEQVEKALRDNYMLCEFKPVQDMSLPIKAIIARNRELHAELLKVASDSDQVDNLLAKIFDRNIRAQLKALVVDRVNRLGDDGPMSKHLDPSALTAVSVDPDDNGSMPSLLDPYRLTEVSVDSDDNDAMPRDRNNDTVFKMEQLSGMNN